MSDATKSLGSRPLNTGTSLPLPIRDTLNDLRGLLGRFVFSQAMIRLSIWILLGFWFFGVVDYFPAMLGSAESPRWVRVGMLAILAAGSLWILYEQLWLRWLVRWSDDSLALLIERKYKRFESSLITTVQASRPSTWSESDHPNRPGLVALATAKALELLPTVDIKELIRTRSLQMQLVALGACLVYSCVAGLLYPQWSIHWGKRLFALSDIPWPRNVSLGVEGIEFETPSFTGSGTTRQRYLLNFQDNAAFVPKGQSGQLKSFASLTAVRVPEVCSVYYRDDDGNRGRANMRRLTASGDRQGFVLDGPPLESLSQSLSLSIVGGDARISDLRLNAVESPVVTDLQLKVTYPTYLRRSTESRWGQEVLTYRTGLRLPQGSTIELLMKSNKPLKRLDYIVVRSNENGSTAPQEQSIALEGATDSMVVPIGVLDGNILSEFRLWDAQGICSSRIQQFVFSSIKDQAPQVDMVLDGIGTSITEVASIPLLGKIKDEYDVQQAWVEAVLDESKPVRIDVAIENNQSVSKTIDCKDLKEKGILSTKPGSTLAVGLSASDYYDLNQEQQVGRASTVQLSIVTADQLLLLLDRREAAMRKRLELILGEVNQLGDLLLSIERRRSESKENQSTTEEAEKYGRIQLLRSQQGLSQVSKSEGELNGVEREMDQISKELVNNRIDSIDRRTRWQEKIQQPLRSMIDTPWKSLATQVGLLEKLFSKNPDDSEAAKLLIGVAIEKNNEVAAILQSILADMLEIQDQTAIVDMLRDIIENSTQVMDETKSYKKAQDKKALDFLK
jgi:hypothetical protein